MMAECLRRPYTETDARERGARMGRPWFHCFHCGDWHVGIDPGRVAPCALCGTLVTIPERGSPRDAARGWLHDAKLCAATRAGFYA